MFIFKAFQDFGQSCTGPSDKHLKSRKGSKNKPYPILTNLSSALLVTINYFIFSLCFDMVFNNSSLFMSMSNLI